MSEMAVSIIDAQRSIHGRIHGSRFDFLVAALSADPETIEELQAALARFLAHDEVKSFFCCFRGGVTEEPWDAGVGIIDLPARIVAFDSTYGSPGRDGVVMVRTPKREVELYYYLSDEWRFTRIEEWSALSEKRRAERLPLFDARAVLYGQVAGFFARECLALADSLPAPAIVAAAGKEQEPAEGLVAHFDHNPMPEELIAVHARWLETPRADLFGKAPRDVLLEHQKHIDLDLQHRSTQWSFVGGCPPTLSHESAAYRFAAFGTHEFVLYYDLLRHLLDRAWQRIGHGRPSPEELTAFLDEERERWLNSVGPDLQGWTPAHVIDCERRRRPMAMSGAQAMVDCECPLCQMMADDTFGPMFWHLDGCNMDDDFVFSAHRTRAEYEEEQSRFEKWNREWEAKEKRRKELKEKPVWSSSFAAPVEADTPVELILLGIGANLAELVQELKSLTEGQPWIERVNRDYGNLRETALHAQSDLVDAVVNRFADALFDIGAKWIELEAKCESLKDRLYTISNRLMGRAEGEDIPF